MKALLLECVRVVTPEQWASIFLGVSAVGAALLLGNWRVRR